MGNYTGSAICPRPITPPRNRPSRLPPPHLARPHLKRRHPQNNPARICSRLHRRPPQNASHPVCCPYLRPHRSDNLRVEAAIVALRYMYVARWQQTKGEDVAVLKHADHYILWSVKTPCTLVVVSANLKGM